MTHLGNEASFSLTHVTHTVTRSEVKLTLLTRRWGANGLSLCITDPMPLLHLRSPLPCPAGLCPSQLHPRHPTRLCTFLFPLSYFPTFSLIFFCLLAPWRTQFKGFHSKSKIKKRSTRFPLLWPNHTVRTSIYLKCLHCYQIYFSWWSYPCLNLNEKVCVFLNTSTISPVAFREWILSYYCIRSTMSMFSHGSFDTFPTSLH